MNSEREGIEPGVLQIHFLYTAAVSLTWTLLKLVTGLRLPLCFFFAFVFFYLCYQRRFITFEMLAILTG